WRLARRDVPVTVLERHSPGAGASTVAAGMLSPLKEAGEPGPFLDLGLRSLERFPEFVREIESCAGMEVGYRQDGRLDVAFTDQEAEVLRRQAGLQVDAGYDARLLEPAELRRLEPEISEQAALGLATELDHQVDTTRLMRALWIAAQREGATLRTGTGAVGVVVRDDPARVTGVRLDSGDVLECDIAVVAAGAWAGGLDLPHPLPIRPVRGQIVVLRSVPPALRRVVWGPGGYLVPRSDGRILVGATMEEAGFLVEPTAGAVRDQLDHAIRVVPVLAGADIDGFQVGLRPGAPDALPVLGPDSRTEGLFFATGHLRNGILLAPETAELLASAILDDGAVPTAFAPERFGPDDTRSQGSEQSLM
ncbi:MAG TPA: glycine oxidase ThiO, partial [Longimicrobiales bacterium]|nr:glycine oxidase ThiO [Longimicrobiales bacterium]